MRSKAEGIHQPLPVASKSASVPRAGEAGPVVLDTTGPRGEANQARKDGNAFLASGVGIGAFGVVSGALLGAVCPVCVVATPALIGAGVYKRLRAWRMEQQETARRTERGEG